MATAYNQAIINGNVISPLERSKMRLHTFIVFLVIVGSVYVDLLNGYFNDYKSISVPVGIVFRTLVILFTFVFIIGYARLYLFKFYIFLIFMVWAICNIFWVISRQNVNPFMEITYFVKLLYPLFIAYYFKFLLDKKYITFEQLTKYTVTNGVICGLFILFSFVTGIGLVTYGYGETGVSYGFGTTSFFKAQNDLSLAMLLTFGFSLYYVFQQRKFINLVKAIVIFTGLILIGTRAGLLGGLVIVFAFVIYETFYGGGRKKSALVKISTMVLLVGITLVGCVFIFNEIKNNPYMLQKYAASELQSPRALLENSAGKYIADKEKTPMAFLFGRGNNAYELAIPLNLNTQGNQSESIERLAEEDLTDMIGGYGMLLACIIFAFPVWVLFRLGANFFRDNKSYLKFTLAAMIFLFLSHSILAGHGIRSPEVGAVLPVLYVYALDMKRVSKLKTVKK